MILTRKVKKSKGKYELQLTAEMLWSIPLWWVKMISRHVFKMYWFHVVFFSSQSCGESRTSNLSSTVLFFLLTPLYTLYWRFIFVFIYKQKVYFFTKKKPTTTTKKKNLAGALCCFSLVYFVICFSCSYN